jgi:hypothetical protein
MKTNFKNNVKIKNNAVVAKHHQTFGLGRFYPDKDCSPTVHAKYIKHTVFQYQGWKDIDMCKGHSSLLQYVAKTNRLTYPTFEKVVSSFDLLVEIIKEYFKINYNIILEERHIKEYFNLSIYGGGKKTWIDALKDEKNLIKNNHEIIEIPYDVVLPKVMTDFKSECQAIMNLVYINNADITERVAKNKETEYKKMCATISYFCGILENHVVYQVYQFLAKHKGIKKQKVLLELDGLCIPPLLSNVEYDKLMVELNKYLLGIDIKFKIKPYIEMPKPNEEPKKNYVLQDAIDERNLITEGKIEGNSEYLCCVFDDVEASMVVFKKFPHWVQCEGILYVFDQESGLWKTDITSYRTVIMKLESFLFLADENGKRTLKSYGNTLILMDKIPHLIRSMCVNDNWIKQKRDSSLKKLLFNNGYFDGINKTFYDKETYGFNPDIVFMDKIHHDFLPFDDNDLNDMESIKERFFYKTLGKVVGDYTIENLARGLMGDRMKRILFGLGATNTGKGVLTKALNMSCGGYVGTFNAGNLALKPNSSSDEAQVLRWAMLLQYKRIIISNEMKSKSRFDGEMLKKIASGGDSMIGRGHGGNETEFFTHFLPICLANDLPPIDGYDDAVDTRVRIVNYTKSFVDREPENEFELKMDKTIDAEIATPEFQRKFVGVLIHAYVKGDFTEPDEVKNCKRDWIDESECCVIKKLLLDYEITNLNEDYVMSNDLQDWIDNNKLGLTMKKFGMELKKYCCLRKFENVNSVDKKVSGKTKKVWIGLKLIKENVGCG